MREKAKILIVDDLQSNRQAFTVLLEPLEEEVIAVESGEAALMVLLNSEVAVVLLDVDMPGMNGFQVAQMIREREKTSTLPILFITAHDATDGNIMRGYDLGAVDFLVKPVMPRILLAKVTAFVDLFHRHKLEQHIQRVQLGAEGALSNALLKQEQELPAFNGLWEAGLQRKLEGDFRELLKQRLEVAEGEQPSRVAAQRLAERIAFAGGGPRELLAIHRKIAELVMGHVPPKQGKALRERCRLLTLELMGFLVESYRRQVNARANTPEREHRDRPPERVSR